MIITITITLLSIYVISVIGMYYWVKLAHTHEKGIYRIITTGKEDLVVTFIPLFNTVFCVCFWIFKYPIETENKDYNKFFTKF